MGDQAPQDGLPNQQVPSQVYGKLLKSARMRTRRAANHFPNPVAYRTTRATRAALCSCTDGHQTRP